MGDNKKEDKKSYIICAILTSIPLIAMGGLTGYFVNQYYRYDCEILKPNVSFTESLCSSYNQTMVLVPIKNCQRLDMAIITSRSNDSINYFKTWIQCWYPNAEFDCRNLYPGMPMEQRLTIAYTEPKVYQMWRDFQTCINFQTKTYNDMVLSASLFAPFTFIWASFFIVEGGKIWFGWK